MGKLAKAGDKDVPLIIKPWNAENAKSSHIVGAKAQAVHDSVRS